MDFVCRSQWPRVLGRGFAAARLLELWFRNLLGAWMFVCCVFSSRGVCVGLIALQRTPNDCGVSEYDCEAR